MKHLEDERLLEGVEGRLDATDAAHLESCAACRDQVTELRAILLDVAAMPGPAPSPLFWEHFRTRISAAVNAAPPVTRTYAGWRFRWLAAASTAATAALIVLTATLPDQAPRNPEWARGSGPALQTVTTADDPDADEAWALVRSVADALDYDSVREAGVTAGSGALERAAAELTAAEQTALMQLLQEEMKRTDS